MFVFEPNRLAAARMPSNARSNQTLTTVFKPPLANDKSTCFVWTVDSQLGLLASGWAQI